VRIAFISGNREKLPDAVVPIGILGVMASVPDHHEKGLIDLCFERRPVEALQVRLKAFAPDLVALGMRNIQNADYTGTGDQLSYYHELIAGIRAVSRAPVVIGGSGFSVMPRELMTRLSPDYGISGEGEEAFPQLVEALESGVGLDEVSSLHCLDRREDGSMAVHSNPPPKEFLDLRTLARPDRSLADPRYYERYGIESIQTKRGCSMRCDYCTYPIIEGRVGRLRDPSAVVDEMFYALEQHPEIRHFFLVDSVFNLPRTHAKNMCRELIARNWSVPWTCYANPLGFDLEMAELAKAAGCAGMEIGSDSGCDEVLKSLRKGFTTAEIRNLHDLCKSVEIPDCHTFILGTRGETLDDVQRSLDFIVSLDPYCAILMVWVDDYESLDPKLRAERLRFRSLVEKRMARLPEHFPYWIIPPLGVNFSPGLFRRLRRDGFHGPLWQHLRVG